jgi:hypothetical protein
MTGTFSGCEKITTVSQLPSSLVNIAECFWNCTNLTTITIAIPSTVTNMTNCFVNCINLTGNIHIGSNQVTDASRIFNNTTLTKNVGIPFKYENGTYTTTYNSFINAGYDELGTKEGVSLKEEYILTITPNPSTATVSLSAPGYTQEGNSILVANNTSVNYILTEPNCVTTTGTIVVNTTKTVSINLPTGTYSTDYTFNKINDSYADITKYNGTEQEVTIPQYVKE